MGSITVKWHHFFIFNIYLEKQKQHCHRTIWFIPSILEIDSFLFSWKVWKIIKNSVNQHLLVQKTPAPGMQNDSKQGPWEAAKLLILMCPPLTWLWPKVIFPFCNREIFWVESINSQQPKSNNKTLKKNLILRSEKDHLRLCKWLLRPDRESWRALAWKEKHP